HVVSYFNSPSLSDGVIQCEEEQFKIHKLVLCAQSKFFSTAFNGEWKESAEGVVHLKDDVRVVEAMLHFMYTFDYEAIGDAENSPSPMVFNVKVYSIAEKYDIPALKLLAKQKLQKTAEICWDMDDFPHAVAEIYASTPSADQSLRQLSTEISCDHIKQLLAKQGFRDVLDEAVGFASDVAQFLAKNQVRSIQPKKYTCPGCEHTFEAVIPPGRSCYCIYCGSNRSNWKSYTSA
ncbi:BTB/POZ domain-containing protein, partial [Paraphaeosphaeria sporulosa]